MSTIYCVMQGSSPRYIGSTTNSLKTRFSQHCSAARTLPRCPLHRAMHAAPNADWSITALQTLEPGTTHEELRRAEQRHFTTLRPGGTLLNRNRPRDPANDRMREYHRRWREAHPGYHREAQRRYRERVRRETERAKL